jgi:hypothetical protein
MGLFEWLFERGNYHKVGSIKTNNEVQEAAPNRFTFWFIILVGQIMNWGIVYILVRAELKTPIENKLNWLLVFITYFIFAYLLRPEPTPGNMGWFGGLIDNPFRITDDINRIIFFLMLFLIPGRVILTSFAYSFQAIRYYYAKWF